MQQHSASWKYGLLTGQSASGYWNWPAADSFVAGWLLSTVQLEQQKPGASCSQSRVGTDSIHYIPATACSSPSAPE